MPRPYVPPAARRSQAVDSAGGALWQRWRWWWLVPLGVLPVLAAVVLASEGHFGVPGGSPVASAPGATSTNVTAVATSGAAQPTAGGAQPAQSTTGSPAGITQSAAATAGAATAPTQSSAGATAQPARTTPQSATASASSPSPASSSTSGPFRAYRVQPGDTVKFVAQVYGVSPASVAQASGLLNPDRLSIGQVLTIPDQPGWLYRLQPGETLDQIAGRTGVASDQIAAASGLNNTTAQAGDVLLIPDLAFVAGK